MTKREEMELAHVLVEIGTTIYYIQKKTYALAKGKAESAAKRLRFLLKVQGEDERP